MSRRECLHTLAGSAGAALFASQTPGPAGPAGRYPFAPNPARLSKFA